MSVVEGQLAQGSQDRFSNNGIHDDMIRAKSQTPDVDLEPCRRLSVYLRHVSIMPAPGPTKPGYQPTTALDTHDTSRSSGHGRG